MNPTIDQLHSHRSIRSYTDRLVPEEDLRTAVAAGQRAATSANIQTYSVIHVTSQAHRLKLVELTGNQEKVAACGAFLIICGDVRRHRLMAERAEQPCVENLESFLLCAVDASLFAQNMVIALESMGWGTCYIGGIRNDLHGVNALLQLPPGVYPLYGLCVGEADESPWERPRLPVDAVLHQDQYPQDQQILTQLEQYDDDMAAYYQRRGASGRRWISQMEQFFANPRRTKDRSFYESQGASLS